MRKWLLLIGFCLAIALGALVPASRAQGPVRVLQNRHSASFPTQMAFHLEAESDQVIEGVTLYYRRQRERITSRIVPSFAPGRKVEATFVWDLERGEVPPGTILEYYWRLDLADGTRFDTDVQSLAYDDDRFQWQTLQSDRLTLLHYGGERQAALARDLLIRGQATLELLQREVGVTLDEPVRVYLYQSSGDMSTALPPRSQGFDERVVTLGVVVADDTLLLLGGHPDVRLTLAHELSHIVVGLATRNPYAPLPRWLDEGLAMYAEGELRADNAQALREAISQDRLISVRSLSGYTGDPSQVDLYYGQAHSLIDFMLRTFGRDKMGQLLGVFREGAHQEDALRQVYGLSLDDLDAAWRQSLGLRPRPTIAPAAKVATPAHRDPGPRQLCPVSSLAPLGLLFLLGLFRARTC